jgi:hypothetical protein
MMPQTPGYPAPAFVPPAPLPAAPPPGYAPPQAPAPMIPPGPPAAVPGVPVAPYAGPPAAPVQHNPYAGSDQASYTSRTPNLPLGTSVLEFIRYERAIVGSGVEYTFITFKVVSSDNPGAPPGSEVAFKQNMNPAGKGGRNTAYGALKGIFFPLIGYSLIEPSHKAHVDNVLCAQGKFSEWLFELETRGTVAGRPLTATAEGPGRQIHLVAQEGTRTPKTPPDKQPFPRLFFSPMQPPLA